MGLLDKLTGGGRSRREAQPSEEAAATLSSGQGPTASTSQPSELTSDLGASSSFGPPRLDVSSATSIPSLSGLASSPSGKGGLYDPYAGISAAAIGRKQLFKLPEQPEFVFEEEAAPKRRGWTENLQFYTGTGYLAGGVAGVGLGCYNYATVKPDFPLDSWKLKANFLLNQSGSKAKPFANASAVLGLYFASFESLLGSQLELPDTACTMSAGALSGALFRGPRGPRQAAAAGLVGLVGGSALVGLRSVFPSL